jgi:non-heme chloroperoxidase
LYLFTDYAGDYRAWEPQLGTFPSNHYRVISYSRRFSTVNQNAGDIREDTVMNNVDDLAGLVKTLGISPIRLVGHSHGGLIATCFAYKHHDLLRSLTLIEPTVVSVFMENPTSRFQRFMLSLKNPPAAMACLSFVKTTSDPALKAIRRGDSAAAARLVVDGIQAKPGSFDTFPEEFQKVVVENVREIYALEMLESGFKRAEMRQIKVPTLIVEGETSHKLLRQISKSLSKIISNSELITIPKSGHWPQIECAQDFDSAVLGFLEKHSR